MNDDVSDGDDDAICDKIFNNIQMGFRRRVSEHFGFRVYKAGNGTRFVNYLIVKHNDSDCWSLTQTVTSMCLLMLFTLLIA